jgi:hypothetical protein
VAALEKAKGAVAAPRAVNPQDRGDPEL